MSNKARTRVVTIKPQEMFLLRPAADLCQECAVKHPATQPHNAQSLYYQTKFSMEHGRAATWADAIAHCSDDVQAFWISELTKLGAWKEPETLTPEQERVAEIERLKERIQAGAATLQDQQRLLWLQSMRPFEFTAGRSEK